MIKNIDRFFLASLDRRRPVHDARSTRAASGRDYHPRPTRAAEDHGPAPAADGGHNPQIPPANADIHPEIGEGPHEHGRFIRRGSFI